MVDKDNYAAYTFGRLLSGTAGTDARYGPTAIKDAAGRPRRSPRHRPASTRSPPPPAAPCTSPGVRRPEQPGRTWPPSPPTPSRARIRPRSTPGGTRTPATSSASVCPPTDDTHCTTYGYGTGTQYPTALMDAGPHSYWRLSEGVGATRAASGILDNGGTDAGTYANVGLGQPGPLPGAAATAAGFNGTSSVVEIPAKLVTNASYQSLSLWFKTSTPGGVLFSYQKDALAGATTPTNYTPGLYIGSSGKLYGQFWSGASSAVIASPNPVTDNDWHHVVLSAAGNTETLYLDGAALGTHTGLIRLMDAYCAAHEYVGGGFLGGRWPDQPHYTRAEPPVTRPISRAASLMWRSSTGP